MDPNIIAVLSVIGYIVIAAIVLGIADRKQSDVGVLLASLWPLFLVALVIAAIGYFPYKIAKESFKKKEQQ